MSLLFSQSLEPGASGLFDTSGWAAIAISGDANSALVDLGEATAYGASDTPVETGTVAVENKKSNLLKILDFGSGSSTNIQIHDWVRKPVLVEAWGIVEAAPKQPLIVAKPPISFDPMPSDEGVIVAPGFAAYDAAIATRSTTTNTFTETYTTPSDKFWAIGAKSVERFGSGRIQFGSGVGRGVYGLAPQFESVNYADLHWAFYVESSSVLKILEQRDGRISLVWEGAWNPAEELAIALDDGQVLYQVRSGDTWSTLYRSPARLVTPCHFCAVLGPLAFIYGVTHDG